MPSAQHSLLCGLLLHKHVGACVFVCVLMHVAKYFVVIKIIQLLMINDVLMIKFYKCFSRRFPGHQTELQPSLRVKDDKVEMENTL